MRQITLVEWCGGKDEQVYCRESKISQVECWTWKDFLRRCSKYGMLLDQQVTKSSIKWKSCSGGING